MACIGGVHWWCSFVACVGGVHWWRAFVACVGGVRWWHALVVCICGVSWWHVLVACISSMRWWRALVAWVGGVGGMWVSCVDGICLRAHKTKMHCQFWWFLKFEVQKNFVVSNPHA